MVLDPNKNGALTRPEGAIPASPFAWKQAWKFADAAKNRPGFEGFSPSRKAQADYARKLLAVANQIQGITAMGGRPEDIERLLREYAASIEPWAMQAASNMAIGVNRKNARAWQSHSAKMGHSMRELLEGPGIGAAVQAAIAENVKLITSLALDSADKIAAMAAEALVSGSRAEYLAKRIEQVGEVTKSRARTIAHTEVSKAGTALTKSRADNVGSKGYIWRTARDGDTRDSHRAMEGKYVPWEKPPTLDNMTGHAGEFPNCRCYPEPVIPRADGKAGVYGPALPTQGQERNAGEQRRLSHWERQENSPVIKHAPGEALLNVDRAAFDMQGKLVDYALNPEHKDGKYKARVFKSALGVEQKDAKMVHDQVMAFLPYADQVKQGRSDANGVRFEVMIPVTGPNGKTVDLLTSWIYDPKGKDRISTSPRLVTIFVPEKSRAV